MLKKKIAEFGEEYCFEELENGLKVYVFSKPDFNTTYAAFGTPFGALDIKEIYGSKVYEFNAGVAHFLEHKLFENESVGVIEDFSKLGALVNAFTSYTETVYYFSLGNRKEVLKALNMLLDFVEDLKIDEDKVEKEKPIIIEELAMYAQMPETRLLNGAFRAMYHNFPLKYDIGGDAASVSKITLDELFKAYELNYHPANMTLVVFTPLDSITIFDTIRQNQAKKSFSKADKIQKYDYEEPKSVKDRYVLEKMDIKTNKGLYGLKMDFSKYDLKTLIKYETGMRFILQLLFSQLNPNYQKWLDERIINYYFGYDVNLDEDFSYMLFYGEGIRAQELKALIDQEFKEAKLDRTKFERLKRRFIGSCFQEMGDVENFVLSFIKGVLNDVDYFEEIKIVMDFSYEDLLDTFKLIDFENYTLFDLEPKIA